jgi:phage/plasmid-like protein (TIGR03299 family)
MAHEIETMAWTGDAPWHGLGVEVTPDLTPEEMMKAAELDWSVSKRPAYTLDTPSWNDNSGVIQAPDNFFIVRDSDNKVLSQAGSSYVPIQNEDIFEFFKKFTEAGHMTMETAGSLKGGSEIWGLAKIAEDFELAGGDMIKGYLLINQPHIVGKSMVIKLTPIRVVCNNTLTIALKEQGAGTFRMPHVKEFNQDVIRSAEEALGISAEVMTRFKEGATFLSKKKAKTGDVLNFISSVYQPGLLGPNGKPIDEQTPMRDQLNQSASLVFDALDKQPGADLASTKGTWWGALNAVTYVEDHMRKEVEQGNALHRAWFGSGALTKSRALDQALQYAKVA